MMNPKQLSLARHALGLPNERKQSYRNLFVAAPGTTEDAQWDALAHEGLAERGKQRGRAVGYCLTHKGAKMALARGERLDPEDFQEERAA